MQQSFVVLYILKNYISNWEFVGFEQVFPPLVELGDTHVTKQLGGERVQLRNK